MTDLETNAAHILRRIITRWSRARGVPLTAQEMEIDNFTKDAKILVLQINKEQLEV